MSTETQRAILDFWFADALSSPEAAQVVSQRWFRQDPAFDAAIRERFGRLPERAVAGALDAWATTPKGALARILVMDQFPRNLHRNDARAYACDDAAQRAAVAAVDAGHDSLLTPLEAVFLYLPFEHAEDLALQERAVALFEALQTRAGAEPARLFAGFADYARRHHEVIANFGRFPHRNGVLARAPTHEEIAWLEAGGERFGAAAPRRPA